MDVTIKLNVEAQSFVNSQLMPVMLVDVTQKEPTRYGLLKIVQVDEEIIGVAHRKISSFSLQ
jgi:hypothetical protein